MDLRNPIRRMVLGAVVALGLVAALGDPAAAITTGPTGKYYLSNYETNQIYVVQGMVVQSYEFAYGTGQSEGTIVSSGGTIRTRPHTTPGGGSGGEYTLLGVPTGTAYTYPTPAGVTFEDSFDATTDGQYNYYVQFSSSGTDQNVYRTDLDWQNPTFLFTAVGACCEHISIAWDSTNNSLWLGGWTNGLISNWSMNGDLLNLFDTGHNFNYALGYDGLDDTLWLVNGFTGELEQWAKDGTMLQSGTIGGLPTSGFLGGDFTPVPVPGSLVLVGVGMLGVVLLGLRRRTAA